jgi:hypothetical protein
MVNEVRISSLNNAVTTAMLIKFEKGYIHLGWYRSPDCHLHPKAHSVSDCCLQLEEGSM